MIYRERPATIHYSSPSHVTYVSKNTSLLEQSGKMSFQETAPKRWLSTCFELCSCTTGCQMPKKNINPTSHFRHDAFQFNRKYFKTLVQGCKWSPETLKWNTVYGNFFRSLFAISSGSSSMLNKNLAQRQYECLP